MVNDNERVHFAPTYFTNPNHPITVKVIGAGGNGSQVVHQLARMHTTLIELGHPGLHVTMYDDDIIQKSNLGRQNFSQSDLGRYKAEVLISRINRFYGLNWEFKNIKIGIKTGVEMIANILISCVDNVQARKDIYEYLGAIFKTKRPTHGSYSRNDETSFYYWMDFGNGRNFGQSILGTVVPIKQPKSKFETVDFLKPLFMVHPEMVLMKDNPQEPSCSTFEALMQQDLFVNSGLVQFGMMIIWELISKGQIKNHGVYVNTEKLTVKPLPV